ncbi:hypothetical protein ABXS75_11865 [Roseburia hominis]
MKIQELVDVLSCESRVSIEEADSKPFEHLYIGFGFDIPSDLCDEDVLMIVPSDACLTILVER